MGRAIPGATPTQVANGQSGRCKLLHEVQQGLQLVHAGGYPPGGPIHVISIGTYTMGAGMRCRGIHGRGAWWGLKDLEVETEGSEAGMQGIMGARWTCSRVAVAVSPGTGGT